MRPCLWRILLDPVDPQRLLRLSAEVLITAVTINECLSKIWRLWDWLFQMRWSVRLPVRRLRIRGSLVFVSVQPRSQVDLFTIALVAHTRQR